MEIRFTVREAAAQDRAANDAMSKFDWLAALAIIFGMVCILTGSLFPGLVTIVLSSAAGYFHQAAAELREEAETALYTGFKNRQYTDVQIFGRNGFAAKLGGRTAAGRLEEQGDDIVVRVNYLSD